MLSRADATTHSYAECAHGQRSNGWWTWQRKLYLMTQEMPWNSLDQGKVELHPKLTSLAVEDHAVEARSKMPETVGLIPALTTLAAKDHAEAVMARNKLCANCTATAELTPALTGLAAKEHAEAVALAPDALHALVIDVRPDNIVRQAAVRRDGDGQGDQGVARAGPDGLEQEPRHWHPGYNAQA